MSDLKPCPFCGGEPERHTTARNKRHSVGCKGCNIYFMGPEEYKAAAAWNQRSTEPEPFSLCLALERCYVVDHCAECELAHELLESMYKPTDDAHVVAHATPAMMKRLAERGWTEGRLQRERQRESDIPLVVHGTEDGVS